MIEVKCNGDLVVNRRSLVYAPGEKGEGATDCIVSE